MRVVVTQKDIDEGKRSGNDVCPFHFELDTATE
jgi:hypothetical protein